MRVRSSAGQRRGIGKSDRSGIVVSLSAGGWVPKRKLPAHACFRQDWPMVMHSAMRPPMQASDLRVALFSGNYNYTRDGANQALNLLVGHLLKQGAKVRVYSPTSRRPDFPPTGDLVSVPSIKLPFGR